MLEGEMVYPVEAQYCVDKGQGVGMDSMSGGSIEMERGRGSGIWSVLGLQALWVHSLQVGSLLTRLTSKFWCCLVLSSSGSDVLLASGDGFGQLSKESGRWEHSCRKVEYSMARNNFFALFPQDHSPPNIESSVGRWLDMDRGRFWGYAYSFSLQAFTSSVLKLANRSAHEMKGDETWYACI